MRRGNKPEVDLARRALAETVDFTLFKHTQQVRLEIERHFADFIQKERAAVGCFDLADQTVAARARESAVHIAKQLACEQVAR